MDLYSEEYEDRRRLEGVRTKKISAMYIASVNVIDIVNLNIPFTVVYTCKKCGELNYLTPHPFWNITDFGARMRIDILAIAA
jgi:hypothetical protein